MPFAITTAKDYREKMEEDLRTFISAIDNSSHAINAVTSAYHLHEWLWAHFIKGLAPTHIDGALIRTKKDFIGWLEQNCPHFNLVQDLTNGSKHAYPVQSTGELVEGYGAGPFGIGPFGRSYLLIDMGENASGERYLVASDVVREAAEFMSALAQRYGS